MVLRTWSITETTEHKAHYNPTTKAYEDVVMKYQYDIKGQLLKSIDPYDRDISVNHYTTAGQMLRTDHIDRGTMRMVMDALGLLLITADAKGARTFTTYDTLQRPTRIRANDSLSKSITLRQILRYGAKFKVIYGISLNTCSSSLSVIVLFSDLSKMQVRYTVVRVTFT